MATGKRASMREGPLAALFRQTEEAAGQAEEAAAAAAEAAQPEDSDPGSPEPQTAAGEIRARRQRRDPEGEREGGRQYPHPSFGETAEAPPEPPRHVPSPQERLRHAFSSETAEDVRRPEPARAVREPEPDPYARPHEEATPFSEEQPALGPVLRVVGVGGAGVNAVNRMVEAEVAGVEFIAINTDLQSLQQSTADVTLHIGPQVTRGLGAGSNPELGRQSAMEEYDRVKSLLKGSDMIFIAAGAGGGTGTGAAPIVARIAREIGALTVGIVTKPFGFEGSRRAQAADMGIQALGAEVDTLIVVPNNRLLSVLDQRTSMVEAFRVADDVLRQGVQGVSDLVTLPGLINLDFADVRTIMSDAGSALLGIGMGVGDKRAIDAAEQAVSSPLLETSMDGARKILLSITGGENLSLWEVNEAAKAVAAAAHPDANIIFGAMVDDKLDDQVWVTVVATGYAEQPARRRRDEPEPAAADFRVERRSRHDDRRSRSTQRTGLGVNELDVPEFIPRA